MPTVAVLSVLAYDTLLPFLPRRRFGVLGQVVQLEQHARSAVSLCGAQEHKELTQTYRYITYRYQHQHHRCGRQKRLQPAQLRCGCAGWHKLVKTHQLCFCARGAGKKCRRAGAGGEGQQRQAGPAALYGC